MRAKFLMVCAGMGKDRFVQVLTSPDALLWSMYSPVVAAPVCMLLFWLHRRFNTHIAFSRSLVMFVTSLLLGSACAFIPIAAVVFALSAEANSGNGPLLLIFLGPGAVSVGAVIGGLVCLVIVRQRHS